MKDFPAPICMFCKRFDKSFWGFRCEAFPNMIPIPIQHSVADHRKPYPDDGGLQFMPKDKEAEEYAKRMFRG